jgi:crossover junction endodeoxyribonuclease RuvC
MTNTKGTLLKPRRIILGIDPGSRITGYGVIAVEGGKNYYLTSGCIRLLSNNWLEKCHALYTSLQQVIAAHQPTEAAIERVFMHVNPSSALKLGQARGAAITALAHHELLFAEYSTREVKKAVVGYGAAQKSQVQQMVQVLLSLSGLPQVDASDALAIALCHSHSTKIGDVE